MKEEIDVWGIEYEEWKKIVEAFFNISNNKLNKHLQTYPFSILSNEQKGVFSSRSFFDDNIKNGRFLGSKGELNCTDSLLQKNNGDLRSVTLVTPLQYLIFTVIGGHLAKKITENKEISTRYYAGNFEKKDLYYASSYKKFTLSVKKDSTSYDYYFKTDFSNFFPSIDISLLFNKIQELVPDEDPRTLLIFRHLIEYFGNGKYPIVDGNSGLSFIATECFLSKFDEKLYYEMKFFEKVTDFNIVRYVDDTFIFFDCSKEDYGHVKNNIENVFQDITSEFHLNCNHEKQKFGNGEEANDDIRQKLYDYEQGNEEIKYDDYFKQSNLEELLKNLLEMTPEKNFSDLKQIFKNSLTISNFKFHYSEILNWYLYEKSQYFEEPIIYQKIYKLSENANFIFKYHSKQFMRMIINTRDKTTIKKVLNDTFINNRENRLYRYQTIMILEYLLATNFKHSDLKKILKEKSSGIYEYIINYCENYFLPTVKKTEEVKDYKLNFLWFMSCYYKKKSMVLEEYAYHKNYFDRKITYIFKDLGVQEVCKKGKISWQYTYSVGNVVKQLRNYKVDQDLIEKVKRAYKLRNENPVNHASSELLNDKKLDSSELKSLINALDNVISLLEKKY